MRIWGIPSTQVLDIWLAWIYYTRNTPRYETFTFMHKNKQRPATHSKYIASSMIDILAEQNIQMHLLIEHVYNNFSCRRLQLLTSGDIL